MNHEDAFWKAVLADPDDDLPRLAFADWLEESGDEDERARAEFIRVQLELAKIPAADPWDPAPPDSPRVQHLREREEQLLQCYRRKWQAQVTSGSFASRVAITRLPGYNR